MGSEKRRSDRHRVRFQLVYDDGESFNAGLVRDLSDTGVFIETALALPLGTRVTLSSLDIEEGRSFDLPARVTRVVEDDGSALDPPGMGFAFDALDDAQQALVHTLIARLEEEKASFEGEPDPWFGKNLPAEGLQRSPSGIWRALGHPGDGHPADGSASGDHAPASAASDAPAARDAPAADDGSPPSA